MGMHLQQQVSTMKIAGSLQKSTEVMKLCNNLIKLPALSKDMQEMSFEMVKAGVIDEMVQDALEEDDDLIDEANEEVDKVLIELTHGIISGVAVPVAALKSDEIANDDLLDQEMNSRLKALKN